MRKPGKKTGLRTISNDAKDLRLELSKVHIVFLSFLAVPEFSPYSPE